MSGSPTASANPQTSKMKKDESFLGKLGGTLVRKKKSKEGEPYEAFFLSFYCCLHDERLLFMSPRVSVHGAAICAVKTLSFGASSGADSHDSLQPGFQRFFILS